jgi:TPR repeat protein
MDHPAKRRPILRKEIKGNLQYQRADEEWSLGRLKRAFRLFLAAAKAGNVSAFGVVAQFYDHGYGVKTNQTAALYWYRRAYRYGDFVAANNMACIWRDRGKLSRAIWWLKRAVKLGNGDANLNIAKIYLRGARNSKKAIRYLDLCTSGRATEGSKEEARLLLRQLKSGEAKRASRTGRVARVK